MVASSETVQKGFAEGQLTPAMRELVSGSGPIKDRSDLFAAEAVKLSGVIASLEQSSIAPSVARAAADLSVGFIAPVADGTTGDLAGAAANQAMATIRASVDAQSKALSQAAAEILAQPKVAERRYVPLTSAEAVAPRYAGDFIPSGRAISIYLYPPCWSASWPWCMPPCAATRPTCGGCRAHQRRRHAALARPARRHRRQAPAGRRPCAHRDNRRPRPVWRTTRRRPTRVRWPKTSPRSASPNASGTERWPCSAETVATRRRPPATHRPAAMS